MRSLGGAQRHHRRCCMRLLRVCFSRTDAAFYAMQQGTIALHMLHLVSSRGGNMHSVGFCVPGKLMTNGYSAADTACLLQKYKLSVIFGSSPPHQGVNPYEIQQTPDCRSYFGGWLNASGAGPNLPGQHGRSTSPSKLSVCSIWKNKPSKACKRGRSVMHAVVRRMNRPCARTLQASTRNTLSRAY